MVADGTVVVQLDFCLFLFLFGVRLRGCMCDVGASGSSRVVSSILLLLCKEFVVVEV